MPKKASATPEQVEGNFSVHAIDTGLVHVQLYGRAIPRAGDPVPGWGAAHLTREQVLALALALTDSLIEAKTKPATKTTRKKTTK